MNKITFQINDLKKVTSRLSGVVKKEAITPILGSALMSVNGDTATFTGTNLQLTIVSSIPCQSEGYIDVAIPIEDMGSIIGAIPPGAQAEFIITSKEVDGAMQYLIAVRSGKLKLDYVAIDPVLFPKLPDIGEKQEVDLTPDIISGLLVASNFSAPSDVLPWKTATLFKSRDGKAWAVGTDGAALYQSATQEIEGIGDVELMLPKTAVNVLSEFGPSYADVKLILPAGDEEITNIILYNDTVTVYVRLIDGEYGKYEGIIPKNYADIVKVNTDEFLTAVRSVGTGTGTMESGISKLDITSSTITVLGKSYENGKVGQTDLEVVSNNGGDLTIGLATSLLMRALPKMSGVLTIKHCNNPDKAVLLSDENDDALCLLMPSRLHF